MKNILVLIAALLVWYGEGYTQDKQPEIEKPAYKDDNDDGINDLFRDANGDGVNDVTGKAYRFNVPFVDANGDGVNDLFRDANGDGVNDLRNRRENGQNASENYQVLDADGDGINDVTGKEFASSEKGHVFIDEDGDGIDDAVRGENSGVRGRMGDRMDRFVDEDGDGINDGRGFSQEKRMKGSQAGQMQGKGRRRGGR